jgi:hypothetical protein
LITDSKRDDFKRNIKICDRHAPRSDTLQRNQLWEMAQ